MPSRQGAADDGSGSEAWAIAREVRDLKRSVALLQSYMYDRRRTWRFD